MPSIVVENCYDIVSYKKNTRDFFFPGELASPDVVKHDGGLFASYPDEHSLSWFSKLMTDCEISLENSQLRQALSHTYAHQQYLLDHLYEVFLHIQTFADPIQRHDFILHFKSIFLDGIAYCTPGLHGRLEFFVCRMQGLNDMQKILTAIRQDLVLEAVNLVNHSVHHFAKFNNSIPDVPKILESDPYAHIVSDTSLAKFQANYRSLEKTDYNGYGLLLRILKKIKEQSVFLGYQGRHETSYRIQEFEAILNYIKTILLDETIGLTDLFISEEENDAIIDINWSEVLLRLIHFLHHHHYLRFTDVEINYLSYLLDTTDIRLEEKYQFTFLLPEQELISSQGLLIDVEFVPQYLALKNLFKEVSAGSKIDNFNTYLNRYVFMDYIESRQMTLLEKLPLRMQLYLLEKHSADLEALFDYQLISQIREYFPFSCVEKLLFIEPLKALHIILKAIQSKQPKHENFNEYLNFLFLNYMLENASQINWAFVNNQQQSLLLQSCLTFINFLQCDFMQPVIQHMNPDIMFIRDRKGHDLVDVFMVNPSLQLEDLGPLMARLGGKERYKLILRLDAKYLQLKKELIQSLPLAFLAQDDGGLTCFKKILDSFPEAIDYVWPLLIQEKTDIIVAYLALKDIYQSESFKNVPWFDLMALFERLDEKTLCDLLSKDLICFYLVSAHLELGPQIFDNLLSLLHHLSDERMLEIRTELYRLSVTHHDYGHVFFEFMQSESPQKFHLLHGFMRFMFEEWVIFSNLYDLKILVSFTLNHIKAALEYCFEVCDSGMLMQIIGFLQQEHDFPGAKTIFIDFMFAHLESLKELDVQSQMVLYDFLVSHNIEIFFQLFAKFEHHQAKLFLKILDEEAFYHLKDQLIAGLNLKPEFLLLLKPLSYLFFYYFFKQEKITIAQILHERRDEILAMPHIWETPGLHSLQLEMAVDIVLYHPQQAILMLSADSMEPLLLSLMVKHHFEALGLSQQLDFIEANIHLTPYYFIISDILSDMLTKFLLVDDEILQQRLLLILESENVKPFLIFFSSQLNQRMIIGMLLEAWLEKENLNGFKLLKLFTERLKIHGELLTLTEKWYYQAFEFFSSPLQKLYFWQAYQNLPLAEQQSFEIKPEYNHLVHHLLNFSAFETHSCFTYLSLYYGDELYFVPEVQNLARHCTFEYMFDETIWRKIKIELCKADLRRLVELFFTELTHLLPRTESEIMPFWREHIAPHQSIFSSFCLFKPNPKQQAIANLQSELNAIHGLGYSA